MTRKIIRLLFFVFLVSFLLIGTLKQLFTYSGFLFKLETIGLLFLCFVSLLGLTSSHRTVGRMILFSVGFFSLVNFGLLLVFFGYINLTLSLVALLLIVVSSFLRETHEVNTIDEPLDHSQVFDAEKPVIKKVKKTANKTNKKTTTKKVSKKTTKKSRTKK